MVGCAVGGGGWWGGVGGWGWTNFWIQECLASGKAAFRCVQKSFRPSVKGRPHCHSKATSALYPERMDPRVLAGEVRAGHMTMIPP